MVPASVPRSTARALVLGLAVMTAAGCSRLRERATPATPPASTNPAGPAGSTSIPSTDPDVVAAYQDHPAITLSTAPPESGSLRASRHWLYYVRGGTLTTVRSRTRDMVSDLIREVGGVGGLNGGFFSDARVAGRGNKMIGPLLTGAGNEYAPTDPVDAPRCVGRPLVVIGATRIAIVPYQVWMGDSVDALRRLLPDATDAFLAGGWLVHNGIAEDEESIRQKCVQDAMDYRRRAVMGVDEAGRIVLVASDYSIDSARLARTLTKLGIREAVLLDSGFSTSLVWHDRILVSGHSRRNMPSRPVPHALIVLAPSQTAAQPVSSAPNQTAPNQTAAQPASSTPNQTAPSTPAPENPS